MLSTSAIYHKFQWTPRIRMWLRRIDHTAIFVLIVRSYTPLCFVALPPSEGRQLLAPAWIFASAGALLSLFWATVPRWINVTVTVAMGWVVLPFGAALLEALHSVTLTLFVVGGVLYSIGGIIYARRAPDPLPTIFGYHEVFHTFVLVAVACHFVAIWRVLA
ncbi:MAG: hemolysin III family protein [Myxococcales bacterium]|nr:hemolysin III family protein [Myxococcales bacterium]